MSRYTPGPWKKSTYRMVVAVGNGIEREIATCSKDLGESDADANARLIAAAPDLVEAARAALKLIRGSAFTENQPTLVQLREAIAKAEGGMINVGDYVRFTLSFGGHAAVMEGTVEAIEPWDVCCLKQHYKVRLPNLAKDESQTERLAYLHLDDEIEIITKAEVH